MFLYIFWMIAGWLETDLGLWLGFGLRGKRMQIGIRALGMGFGFGGQGWSLAFVVGAPATVSPGR